MGKRSNFELKPMQKYYTPYSGVVPLLPHLPRLHIVQGCKFIEPCAGDGRLIRHLESDGHKCVYACDIKPEGPGIEQRDVLFFDAPLPPCDLIITNPPWERDVLHPMIEKFTDHAPTWLLFQSDWAYTKQAKKYEGLCKKIVSVGRIQWIEGTKGAGMENCSWYYFDKAGPAGTQFYFSD